MRAIIPNPNGGGYHLDQAHSNPPQNGQQATSRWKSFHHKAKVQNRLLADQYGLCCYSELRADLAGLGYHIEHILLKSLFPHRTFDYINMATSALSSDDLHINQEVFGGHAPGKQKAYDLDLFISCHDADCGRYFAYLSDGRVVASNSLNANDVIRAKYTINLLNLNCAFLKNRRLRWFNELDELFNEHEDKNWSVDDLVSVYLLPTDQKLCQFFSLTRQFFAQKAEQVLRQSAPELV
ncbi:MAG: TIGR02646 family protein [Methylomonas lenta]|nr:TIGR02646 family protein [Methylomonas lenta]